MFDSYLKEKENLDTYTNDHGFAAYNVNKISKIMDIGDFYIKPEHRNNINSVNLFNEIVELAKTKKCTKVTAMVDTTQTKVELSLKALLKVNFKLSHLDGEAIYFYQNI